MDADLVGIVSLLRTHLEIRNRSWMKRLHRDCFIGSDAVDFLVTQGLADNRKQAVEIGSKLVQKKFIRRVIDSSTKFTDSYHYFRFFDDDIESAILAKTNAGNGNGTQLGHGGCKWSFCPHTAHNSYILDIGLAEEIERAVSGASIEARSHAIGKLRSRVREQAENDAPDWILTQSTQVNKTSISIYQRKRPRGDFKNVKMTGMVGESPKGFIKGILNFSTRKQWESMFEDGVIVEGIETGEPLSILIQDDLPANNTMSSVTKSRSTSPTPSKSNQGNVKDNKTTPSLPDSNIKTVANLARKTDDLVTFLQTVDLAGVPSGMAIAFLNDPERQHALTHLRKQMMLSNPHECMLCSTPFDSPADIRFCPCCAMVSCGSCVSKRVFEVVSRQVVSVCVHCYRESSRVRHSPQAVQDDSNIDASIKGKWWRPEELGIVDYSNSNQGNFPSSPTKASGNNNQNNALNNLNGGVDLYNEDDVLVVDKKSLKPLVPGLLDDIPLDDNHSKRVTSDDEQQVENDNEWNDGEKLKDDNASTSSPTKATTTNNQITATTPQPQATVPKTARCKNCGSLISRDISAIEAHMEECHNNATKSIIGVNSSNSNHNNNDLSYSINPNDGSIITSYGNSKSFAGISRVSELNKCGTRIIYRTARAQNKSVTPREVCAFQDSFVDPDGTCYVYEISVRHIDVRGIVDYSTADVMTLMHVAKPVKGSKGNMSNITIISQVDTRSSGQWLLSYMREEDEIGIFGKDDLIRELKGSGNLQNILKSEQETETDMDASIVTLEDFELLAVLGRGGFGKVMQVRHKPTDEIYAMKILKKSELRRRKQVERTQTERTILANVRHPFIVCLHYAFQNQQKLYMVMDFVQGGDFFTMMRKFKRIPEDWVRLYVIEVAMALQHLHDMDVVYRDLKPENILLCGDGHLKLTDFGLSRFFETRPPAPEDMIGDDDVVTRSFCGTEQYMSPEMLLQQGHNYRMDWWCLGLLMHEMICSRHPFQGPTHYDTLRNMVTKPPTIDSRLSPNAASIVKNFLIKNPKARLCCRDGIAEMKASPFFACVNWDDLYDKRIIMPYKPKLQNEHDVSSFETTFTREKPIDSITEADTNDGRKKNKNGSNGILKMFGYGNNNTNNDNAFDEDSFKGFSFTKEEEILSGNMESDNQSSIIPPPPPPLAQDSWSGSETSSFTTTGSSITNATGATPPTPGTGTL
eukprot:gene5248-7293_t